MHINASSLPQPLRSAEMALLIVSAATLTTGLILFALGRGELANAAWTAGSLPVLIALLISIVKSLRRHEAGVDVLALVAVGFALALSEYLTAAVISLMLSSGRALEDYARERARRELTALMSRAPRFANRFEDGEWRCVELDMVRPGDQLLVRSGESVPVDGSLVGQAQLDESTLTGESILKQRTPGESVNSGVVNAGTAFEMIAAARAQDSTFAGIVRMVQSAQQARSPSARLADRYALIFVVAALLVAAASWLVSGQVDRALAVLVVATPCPLILAVPVAVVSGMSRCAKHGILIKSGGALERLAQATVLFFDKTGTLTAGRARLVSIEAESGTSADTVLRYAASVGQASAHVISEAVTTAARERGLALSVPREVIEEPGAGVTGTADGQIIKIGSFDYVSSGATPPEWSTRFLRLLAREGAAAVFVSVDGRMVGALQMADQIRLETPRALRLLRLEGIKALVMLTGDRRDVAETVGAMLGVTEVRSELTPSDKLTAIRSARPQGTVVMIGDGINDAPALAAADVGIAMGARGAAASSEAADVVLLVDRLDRIVDALRIAKRTRKIAVESVIAGMLLSSAAMIVAAVGLLPPIYGAMLQEVIDVAVIANALRALQIPSTAKAGRLARVDADRLMREHVELGPITEQIRELADSLPGLPASAVAGELARVNDLLSNKLLPHEQRDDQDVYPQLARLVGGEDPMAAMSAMHREIFRVSRLFRQATEAASVEIPDREHIRELQRLLYGLDAVVRLHCAQEDELIHVLGDEI
jgi:heavy metal translocating P-type ATPase